MPDHDSIDDVELMRRVAQQDEQALSELYDQYARLVFSLAMRIVGNRILAEEITQDAFLKLWRQAHQWNAAKGRLGSWLLTITRHTAIDRLRKEQRRPGDSATSIDTMIEVLGRQSVVDDPRWQDGRLLRTLIQGLPPDQLQVVEMAFYQGMAHTEIADHLQLPLGTVKTRVRLGLQKLREAWLHATEPSDEPGVGSVDAN